jgi:hypothetical protein
MSNMQNTVLIATGIVAALPLIPAGHFLLFGWPARKEQIVSRFSDEAIGRYRQMFRPESRFKDSEGFSEEYDLRYGRRLFVFPVLLFAATVIGATYWSMAWVFSHDWASASEGTAKVAIFSLAGAYVWVTFDLILRARQNDVVTADINGATLRLLVSLPFGFAISAFAGVLSGTAITLSTGALAFFVGAFPTDTVLKFMRRTAAIPLKLDANTESDGVQQLTKIDGISVPIAERLIDEGVKTNLQLAYADPITLTIKTGMDFSFILDCCGQALVRMYFDDDQIKQVHRFALRTGVEAKGLNDTLTDYDEKTAAALAQGAAAPPRNPTEAAAQIQLEALAGKLGLDPASTRFIIDQIADDPYTDFAFEIWASQYPKPAPDSKPAPEATKEPDPKPPAETAGVPIAKPA